VIRNTRHSDRIATRRPARRERDIEQPRGLLRVAVKKLVEVAHAIEEQHVRMFGFDAEVLLHQARWCRRLCRLRAVTRCGGVLLFHSLNLLELSVCDVMRACGEPSLRFVSAGSKGKRCSVLL
jgi:hypothetical protein